MALLLLLCLPLSALSQVPATEDPAHNELRALRDGLIDAIKKGDLERELSYLHPNVVITWQNAEVSRGREGVRKYLDRMLKGPDAIVDNFSIDLNVDELTILYGGDTGISFGTSKEHVALKNGSPIDYNGRWSATLVKEGGQWLVASAHASTNLFENPFIGMFKRVASIAGAVSIIIAIGLGYWFGRSRSKALA